MESPRFMPTPYFILSPQSLFFFFQSDFGSKFSFFSQCVSDQNGTERGVW